MKWEKSFFLAWFVVFALWASVSWADVDIGPRDIDMFFNGVQGYINDTFIQNGSLTSDLDGRGNSIDNVTLVDSLLLSVNLSGVVDAKGYQISNPVIDNATLTSMNPFTENIKIQKLNPQLSLVQTSGNPDIFFANTTENLASVGYDVTGDYIQFVDPAGAGSLIHILMSDGSIIPATNNSADLGTNLKKFARVSAVVNDIGHLEERYTANPADSYSIGDAVALDLSGSGYEIKLAVDRGDRIVGIVSDLPHTVTDHYQVEEYVTENGASVLRNVTKKREVYISTYGVAVYGKYSSAKVKGTINAGDILVASGTPGVLTSMYNTAHPLWPSLMPASTDPNVYNSIAKLLPYAGLAMQSYNSQSVGVIPIVVGKP
jgi:hypothetical protein